MQLEPVQFSMLSNVSYRKQNDSVSMPWEYFSYYLSFGGGGGFIGD